MKKRLSLLLLVTGLFLAGATFTAKAGDEKCGAKTEKKCDGKKAEKKEDKKEDQKCDAKKSEEKTESKSKDTKKK